MFYTGDTGWREDLPALCAGADLLLADACFSEAERAGGGIAPHLTASEAGRIAKEGGVKRLLCTHLWGGGCDEAQLCAEACAQFPDSAVAAEMQSYLI